MNRDKNLLDMRPEIPSAKVRENMSTTERFQNETLRPIIKFQHELLLDAFNHYIEQKKNVYRDLSVEKRTDYIDNVLFKDKQIRSELKGIIIGQFTIEEYKRYRESISEFNKRIMNMLKEKMMNSLEEV